MTNTTKAIDPADLLQLCLEQATAFPAHHDQDSWIKVSSCGTTGCLAGHAVALGTSDLVLDLDVESLREEGCDVAGMVARLDASDRVIGHVRVMDLAAELLDLSDDDAEYMFSWSRELDELWTYGEEIYPGVVEYPSEARLAEIRAAGPLLVEAVTRASFLDEEGSIGVIGELLS